MNKHEAKFQTLFNHWIRANMETLQKSAYAFELKDTRGKNALSWDAVEDHQIDALLAASQKGLIYKISDQSSGFKPFDCFVLKKASVYVVVKFPKFFCFIDINKFMFAKERRDIEESSLTADLARRIAKFVVEVPGRASLRK